MKDIFKYLIVWSFLLGCSVFLSSCGSRPPKNSNSNGEKERFTCTVYYIHNAPDIFVYTDAETNKEYIVEGHGHLLNSRDIPAEKNGEKTSKQ